MNDPRIRGYWEQHDLGRFLAADQGASLELKLYRPGETLCAIDEPVRHLQFMVDGRAKVYLPAANGKRLLLCFYEPLQVFGDLEIVEGTQLATATVEAITPCASLRISRQEAAARLETDPRFLRQVSASLARKLDRLIRNGALNLLHPVENRLASYVLATATVDARGHLRFRANLTQVAEMLGTSFRHLHRTLGALCEQGILLKDGGDYVVQQPAELRSRAAGVYVTA